MLKKFIKILFTSIMFFVSAVTILILNLISAATFLPDKLTHLLDFFFFLLLMLKILIYIVCTCIFYIIWYKKKAVRSYKSIVLSAVISATILLVVCCIVFLVYLEIVFTGCWQNSNKSKTRMVQLEFRLVNTRQRDGSIVLLF